MTAPLLTTRDLGDLSPQRAVRIVADGQLSPVPPQVAAIIARIDADPSNVLPMRRLAKLAGLSEGAFGEAFRTATGLNPKRYATDVRMRAARQLLGTSTVPVGQIGREVGYQTTAAFSKAFHAENGIPPLAYRRQVRP